MSPRDFPCPRCGAEAGERCRTLATGRTTDTHASRINAYHDQCRKEMKGL